jgi:hypothetical protein
MKTSSLLLVIALLPGFAFAQSMPAGHPKTDGAQAAKMPAGHPPMDSMNKNAPAPAAQLTHKGKVVSVTDVPQYTYLEVTENNKTSWIAAPTVAVKKGDMVRFDDGMNMTNFHSKSLNRTFPSILFVGAVVVAKDK